MVSPRDHVIPIPHYRPTAQLMKDRDRQEQTYLLSPVLRTSRTFITNVYKRSFIFYEKRVYKRILFSFQRLLHLW